MASSLIIVEDQNDQYTFEAIIRHLGLKDELRVNTKSIEWKTTQKEENPNKPTALIRELNSLKNDISSEKYDKIAIIQDMDNSTQEEMLLRVNNALKSAYSLEYQEISSQNESVAFKFQQNSTDEILTVYFSCHFVGIYSDEMKNGEIEDILKVIKSKASTLADCINNHLPDCLGLSSDEQLSEKDLVKLWINHYQRYDTLTKKDRTGAFTSWKNVMEKRATELFDFDKNLTELNELKQFLKNLATHD